MSFYRKITSLIQPSKNIVSFTEAEKALRWQQLQEDLGEFVYEEDGFRYPFKEHDEKLKWTDIERIVAYKPDLMTMDELCVELFSGNWKITYSESLPGWYQFVKKLNMAFPSLPDDWDWRIIQPPFATNYTVLYEREDRKMPESTNFYASLKCKAPEAIVVLFEEPAWTTRKAGRTEWEITNSWAELHLEPCHDGLLLNGLVAYHPDNVTILNRLLDRSGVSYQYEFYDVEKNLLIEKSFP